MFNIVAHALYRPHVTRMTKRVGRRLRPIRPSRQAELWYLNRLTDVIPEMRRAAQEALLAHLPGYHGPGVHDAAPWDRALRELAKSKPFNSLKAQAQDLSRLAAKRALFWVDDRLAKEVSRSLGVDIRATLRNDGPVADRMKEFVTWNVDLISTLPDRFKDDLEDQLSAAWGEGLRAKAIADIVDEAIARAGENCEANASLIARDQMNKMNAAFNQVRQTGLGIRRYAWRTSDDERVRHEHMKMETLDVGYGPGVFAWDEPGPLAGTIDGRPCHPGEDIQCRCDAIPVFDLDMLEEEVRSYS
jgi:SPP1 gp7 family putative phage head morphogenesis protein